MEPYNLQRKQQQQQQQQFFILAAAATVAAVAPGRQQQRRLPRQTIQCGIAMMCCAFNQKDPRLILR
jgi:hypothetical protein